MKATHVKEITRKYWIEKYSEAKKNIDKSIKDAAQKGFFSVTYNEDDSEFYALQGGLDSIYHQDGFKFINHQDSITIEWSLCNS